MADSSYLQGDHDNAVAVPFSDDETTAQTEDLDEDSPGATPEEQATRRRKRTERYKRLLDEGKQSKEELAALKTEAATTRAELERLKGYVAAQPQQRPANDSAGDPYEQRLNQVYARQSEAYNAAQAEIKAGTFTPERQQHYEQIAREIESQKTIIHTERVVEARLPAQRAEQAQQVWVQKYPEVYNNPAAFEYAQGTWQRRKAQARARGEALSNDVVDEVMAETMNEFKLGKKQPPTASERSRLSGMPSAGSGGGSRAPGIVATPAIRRMAIAAHSELSEEEALKKWTNTTGKRLRERKIL